MKAVISNRIYLEATVNLAAFLKQTLTYKIVKEVAGSRFSKFASEEIIKNYKQVNKDVISIPSGRLDLIPEDYEVIDKRVLVPAVFPEPKFGLYPDQLDVYNEVDDCCFINAKVGWGKTFTALHVAAKLGQKTLIVTHNTFLRDQWFNEVKKLYGFEPGVIGSGKKNMEPPIVVANVQTLTKMILEVQSMFGTLILDEAHHCPATTFGAILDNSRARYKIGLSGTRKRKDGKEVIFNDYFGHKILTPPESNTMKPTVRLVKSGIVLTPGATWAKKINDLLYDIDYQNLIANIVSQQVRAGHKVLVVASRTEFLLGVANSLGDRFVPVIGETTQEEREVYLTALEEDLLDGFCGSRQIWAEGISANPLSCIVLAEPISNDGLLEQLIGRIQRLWEGKLQPLVIDIHFNGYSERKQNNQRLAFYLDKGWEVDG